MKYVVCDVDELERGEKRAYRVANRSVVLVRTQEGAYYAVKNVCPHHGAEMDSGVLLGRTKRVNEVGVYDYVESGEILRCPWHGYEFDVTTGCSLFEPEKVRIQSYPVTIDENNQVVVEMKGSGGKRDG